MRARGAVRVGGQKGSRRHERGVSYANQTNRGLVPRGKQRRVVEKVT